MALLVLDTSVLIFDWQPERAAAVSAVSVGELHAGVALASNAPEERRRRRRLDEILCVYAVLVVDLDVARAFGDLVALSRQIDGPRNRADLLIAAGAVAHDAGLATTDKRLATFARRAGLEVVEPPESWAR